MNTFDPKSIKAFNIWFNSAGQFSDDPKVTDLLSAVDEETGENLPIYPEICDAVIEACNRLGLEYVCDDNFSESEIVPYVGYEAPAILLSDWVSNAHRVYNVT